MAYSKLHSSIVNSSLWCEPDHIRLLFITLLAMCDREGYVYGSKIGIERTAMINWEEGEDRNPWLALMSPDSDSSDKMRAPEHEGRRIEEVPGGFRLLNFAHYRGLRNDDDRRDQNRRAQEKYRSKPSSAKVSHGKPQSAASKPISDADAESLKTSASPCSSEHQAFIQGWSENFKAQFGFDYSADGGRDGKAVKELLRIGILRIDLLEIAKSAWKRSVQPPKSFNCEKASTIHGFREYLNQIRTELSNGNQSTQSRPNQRNLGIAIGPTDYGEAIKRKLERQMAESKARGEVRSVGNTGT